MTRPPRRLVPVLAAGLPIAAAVSLLPLSAALALCGGLFALALLVVIPAAAPAAVAFAVPFGDSLRIPAGGLAAGGAELALLASAGLWWLRGCRQFDLGVPRHPVWWGLAAMLAAVVASVPGAPSLDLALKELAKWAFFGVALALGMALARDRRAVVVVVAALLLAGAAEAEQGLLQSASTLGPVGFLLGGTLRAFGSFGQPNPFAVYLATIILVGFGLLLALGAHPRRLLSWRAVVLAVPCWLMLSALLASLSRGALLALAAGGVAMVLAYRPRVLTLAPLALAGVVALWVLSTLGLVPDLLAGRVASIFDNLRFIDPRDVQLTPQNFAVVQRMAIWEAAGEMFFDHPWFGVGAGNFDQAYLWYALPDWRMQPGHAHNYYLNLLAELGVSGLLAYGVLVATVVAGAITAVGRTRTAAMHATGDGWLAHGMALSAVGLAAAILVHHLFDNLYVHGIGTQVGLLLGIAFGLGRSPSPLSAAPPPHSTETNA